jgi:hypothetical protein
MDPQPEGSTSDLVKAGLAALGLACVVAACAPAAQPFGAARDYADHCAACHGPSGRGNGTAAVGMHPAPSDLSLLARRNGGVFPKPLVIRQLIDDSMGRSLWHPPVSDTLREGPVVMYDDGSGRRLATPARLVALADYLLTLQR